MIDEIKQRIEQIKAGRTPEGYIRKTKIGIIPNEWEVKPLRKILYPEERKVVKPTQGYWRLGLRSHAKGTFHEYVEDPASVGMDELFLVKENDLIVNITFAWEHAVAIANKDDENKLVSHRFPTYVFLENSYPMFYKYVIALRWFKEMLDNISPGGAGRNRVMNKQAFLKLDCIAPPLAEQKKIAEILATYDKVIELKERLIEEKKRRKKWLIQKLLNPKSGVRLPGFKDDWDFVKLNEVVGLSTEKYNPIISDIDYICIELEHIEPFSGRLIGYTSSKRQKSIKNVFHKGQVLFGKLRPYLRKYLKPELDGVCSTEIWVFDCKTKRIIGDFLFYLVQSDNFINNANLSSGSKMPRADWDHVRNITIPLPSIPEQTAIAQIFSTADREIELLEKELEETKLQKKALMQLLLTGIVRVNDQLAMSN